MKAGAIPNSCLRLANDAALMNNHLDVLEMVIPYLNEERRARYGESVAELAR